MTTLTSGLLPPNPISIEVSSSHKLSVFQTTKFGLGGSTNKFHGGKGLLTSTHRKQPALVTSLTKNRNQYSLRIENDIEIGQYLSLLNGKLSADCRQIHAQAVKLNAVKRSSLIGNKLAVLYLKNKGSMDNARKIFDEIPERTLPTYAALIGSYCRSRQWEELFLVLGSMMDSGMLPDGYLVPTILKACSAKQMLKGGMMIHGYVIRKELGSDVFVGNALIDLYSNCGDLRSSVSVFDTMRLRDVVSWTALVSAYMDEGLLNEAIKMFNSMQLNGVKPDVISWNALISGFARNGEIDLALQSLKEMQEGGLKPRVNSWNGLISGCVQNGFFEDALDVLYTMSWFPEDLNAVTVASILPACAGLKDLDLGRAIHGYAIKQELAGNFHVEGSLIDIYSKCGIIHYAEKVFDRTENKNTAMWNEMIAAYVSEEKMEKALELLGLMQNESQGPDVITYNTLLAGYAIKGHKNEAHELLSEMVQMAVKPNVISMNVLISGFQKSGLRYESLKVFQTMQSGDFPRMFEGSIQPNSVSIAAALAACADLSFWCQGKEIHGYVLRNGFESNVYVLSALVDMYTNSHDMDSAIEVFRRTEERSTIIWNALLAGHVKHRQPEVALKLFYEMMIEGLRPSSISFLILLSACNELGALNMGRVLHGYILKSQFHEHNNPLATALVGMYSRSGRILEAKLVFDSEVKDLALCNAMISSYSIHGMVESAIVLFETMKLWQIAPNGATFLALLFACARHGLVEEGFMYFNSMKSKFGITAGLEHYTCMVGLLGTACFADEAVDLIRQMPYTPDAGVWATLMEACGVHHNMKIGYTAAEVLSEPEKIKREEGIK
ncbi:Pentatricopeptide repeat-containing protein [Quillaja saponaria]|uniref:Pentatricopeptide repeat-containing protein n=1 Tax=Quillaja saponaria TaxID=32244 RepID=A0AAD7LJ02_QUISA|nr:Pentatricopeptide repeat-containing protein [Quillaja saponaria]